MNVTQVLSSIGTVSWEVLLILIMEGLILYFLWAFDRTNDIKDKILYFIIVLVVIVVTGELAYPHLQFFHSTTLASVIMTILTFIGTTLVFDVPAWWKDKENATLKTAAKRYKTWSQLILLTTTAGIAIWQSVPWKKLNEPDLPFMSTVYLIISILIPVGFILFAMGIMRLIAMTRLFDILYDDEDDDESN